MKKSLLVMLAAVVVVMGASAQARRTAKFPKANVQLMNTANPQGVKAQKMNTMETSTPAVVKSVQRKGASDVSKTYILNTSSWPGEEPAFVASTSFTIESESGTIELDGDLFGQSDNISFPYNVKLVDFAYKGYPVYGNYDEETSSIFIPVQTLFEREDYGRIVFSAAVQNGQGEPYDYGYSMTLLLNEDGSVEIDEGDFSEAIESGVYEDDSYYFGGFWNFMPDYLNDKGYPYAWNYGFDAEIFVPNATLHYATTGKSLGGDGSSWQKVEIPSYVEDYGTEWVVSNFLGITTCSVTINGDGTCYIPFGQIMDDYNYSDYDTSYDYGYMRLVGCVIDGNSIMRDYSKTALNGFNDETVAYFFKTEYKEAWTDEEGEHDEGNYYVDEDPDYCRYFAIATAASEDGAYSMGWCCNLWLEIGGEDLSGINNVSADNRGKAAATYNLMGQQVSGDTKGLVIRDGKKFVNR